MITSQVEAQIDRLGKKDPDERKLTWGELATHNMTLRMRQNETRNKALEEAAQRVELFRGPNGAVVADKDGELCLYLANVIRMMKS